MDRADQKKCFISEIINASWILEIKFFELIIFLYF